MFKVGDRVRCTRGHGRLKEGMISKVSYASDDHYQLIGLEVLGETDRCWLSSRFVLVSTKKPFNRKDWL